METLLGRRQLIVVMPDDGYGGSYSDWYGSVVGDPAPTPTWERYHVEELVPYVDAHYSTIARYSGRFIDGVSSGGPGSTKYAATFPAVYGAVGSFSGAIDIYLDYPLYALYPMINEGLDTLTDYPPNGPDAHCTWGDPYTQRVVWYDNDPTVKAAKLKGAKLFVTWGRGYAGPYDSPGSFECTESEINYMNLAFVAARDAGGVAHTDESYGPGSHTRPYFTRDLVHFLSWLGPAIADTAEPPNEFPFLSARSTSTAWGWTVTTHRPVRCASSSTPTTSAPTGSA